jgi:hypothetical protein
VIPGVSEDQVPAALAARMLELARTQNPSDGGAESLVEAAVSGLTHFIRRPAHEQSALDLLALDGLLTAAFSAELPADGREALADRAARRLLALGDHPA